jgi:hypothetical protein
MISGILNLLSNTNQRMLSGQTTTTQTAAAASAQMVAQGFGAEMKLTQVVPAVPKSTAAVTTGESTQSGGGAARTPLPATATPEEAAALAVIASEGGESGYQDAGSSLTGAYDGRLRTVLAAQAFGQGAMAILAPAGASALSAAPETTADEPREALSQPQISASLGRSTSSLAVQERLIRADLAAELTQIAKTRDIGPADALRLMAGHVPQFPLEDPDAATG